MYSNLFETVEISWFCILCLVSVSLLVGMVFEMFLKLWVTLFDLVTSILFPKSLKKAYWIHAKDFQIYMYDVRLWKILHDKEFKRMRLAKKILKKG